jgi:hypothetical protein
MKSGPVHFTSRPCEPGDPGGSPRYFLLGTPESPRRMPAELVFPGSTLTTNLAFRNFFSHTATPSGKHCPWNYIRLARGVWEELVIVRSPGAYDEPPLHIRTPVRGGSERAVCPPLRLAGPHGPGLHLVFTCPKPSHDQLLSHVLGFTDQNPCHAILPSEMRPKITLIYTHVLGIYEYPANDSSSVL